MSTNGSNKANEWKPTGRHWWFRTFVELAIGVLAAFLAWQVNDRTSSEADARQDKQIQAQLEGVEEATERADVRNRIDVLGEWLPQFLDGEQHAERMITTLLPGVASDFFEELRKELTASGDTDEQLAAAVDQATINAARADAVTAEFAIVAGNGLAMDDAEELKVDLQTSGTSSIEIVATDDGFDVLVTGFSSIGEADTVRSLLEELSTVDIGGVDRAEIVNLAERDPVGSLRAVPDVFNCTEQEALDALDEAGFDDVVVWRIPSDSVEIGNARELVLNDGAPPQDEIEVVNTTGFGDLNPPDGPEVGALDAIGSVDRGEDDKATGVSLPVDTPLALKVANSSPTTGESIPRPCGLG